MLLIFNCDFGHFGDSNEVPMYTEASMVGRRKEGKKGTKKREK